MTVNIILIPGAASAIWGGHLNEAIHSVECKQDPDCF